MTVVVPVKNNQRGIERVVHGLADHAVPCREVILVDNRSAPAMTRPHAENLRVRLLRCETPGPAAARNVGWQAATTPWVLFLDSDCIPTPTTISGYARTMNGAVAYAGMVRSVPTGPFASYYDTQKTLIPPPTQDNRPEYLVTANALVYRPALIRLGGFSEKFDGAGGEDIDLALRLWGLGDLSYAPDAVVHHEFGEDFSEFVNRFVRYGRGNRQLQQLHRVPMVPMPFAPAEKTPANWILAATQFAAMTWGYFDLK